MIVLKVPFHEKDEAKALGAKWNPDIKAWFITSKDDKLDFDKWIPSTGSDENKSMNLSDLLFRIETSLKSNFPSHYWVKAEISNISDKNHLYIDLVEFNDSKIELAKIRGVIWSDDKFRILNKFLNKTSESLNKGISVLLKVSTSFHPRFGMSLNIHDIDPSYTIGAMQAKINEIVLELKQSGIIHNNKSLTRPKDFTNVAVISPKDAAGLGDFRVEADILESNGLCNFSYFDAIFQGDSAKTSISDAFETVNKQHDFKNFDALIFIRGGGSKSDLHFVNELEIASNICNSKMPVFVGIGHEQDRGIPDLVSNMSFDTPSKVILHIQSVIINNAMMSESYYNNIINNALHDINLASKILTDNISRILLNSHSLAESSALNLRLNFDNIYSAVSNQVELSKEKINSRFAMIRSLHTSITISQESNLQYLIKSIIQNNPINIMDRGFAIVKMGDDYIPSIQKLNKNDEVTILLKDGNVSATIK